MNPSKNLNKDTEVSNEGCLVNISGNCYSGYELILLATEMEKVGSMFYKRAAQLSHDKDIQNLFNNMANEELEHIKTLNNKLKPILTGEDSSDWRSDEEVSQYLIKILGPDIFPSESKFKENLKKISTVEEAINLCITGEQKAIIFYKGMLEYINCDESREALEKIIEMEKKHKEDLKKLKID